MSIQVNAGFDILAPEPGDSRTVQQSYTDLALIPIVYVGLRTYVIDDDKTYIYKTTGWAEYITGSSGGGGSVAWGSITGEIQIQTDLMYWLGKGYQKTGGTISGNVIVAGTTIGDNFILTGADASEPSPVEVFFGIETGTLKFTGGQTLDWNTVAGTINIPTGKGPIIQAGLETLIRVWNNSGATILDGSVLYPSGVLNGLPTVGLCLSDSHETIALPKAIATSDILDNSDGYATITGAVNEIDTTGLSLGPVYISPTVPGALTSTKPTFPDYPIAIASCTNVGVLGSIITRSSGGTADTFQNYWNGTFRESFDFRVSVVTGDIIGSLDPSDGHPNLTMFFSTGFATLVTTPAATITLTAGTDTVPQTNYVYIPITTKVLTLSLTGWPDGTEHIKVANLLLRSVTATTTDDALGNRNWNNHLQNSWGQGHGDMVGTRIRKMPAAHDSGGLTSVSISNPNVFVATTEAKVYQMHKQTFPAVDTSIGDHLHVVNDSIVPYVQISDIGTLQTDALGATLNNMSFSYVLWGVANKTGEQSHLMLNLPTGAYAFTSPTSAVADASSYSVYDVPAEFEGTAFLIARLTFTLKNNVWVLIDNQSLLGRATGSSGGGAGSSGYVPISTPPATPTTTGSEGQIVYATDGIYVCIAVDTWKRTLYDVWV